MSVCQVRSCSNNSRKKVGDPAVQYFKFPRNVEFREKWREAAGRDELNVKDPRICSVHFEKDCYKTSWIEETYNLKPQSGRRLKDGAVPTLFLPTKRETVECSDIKVEMESEPLLKIIKREEHLEPAELPQTHLNYTIPSNMQSEALTCSCGKGIKRAVECETSQFGCVLKRLKSEYEARLAAEVQKRVELEKTLQAVQAGSLHFQRIMEKRLSTIFTPGQIKAIMKPGKHRILWSKEDIAAAMSAIKYGVDSYEYWRVVRHVPMPAPSTLRKWEPKFPFKAGILKAVLKHMGSKGQEISEFDRLTVLSINKVELQYQEDTNSEQIAGPNKAAQISTARGLFGRWKAVVHYEYGKTMTLESLFRIIIDLYDKNYPVAAAICDQAVLTALNIGIEHKQSRFFLHPRNASLRVYVCADTPELLISIRNHFLDYGFMINGSLITTECIRFIVNSSDSLDPKIDRSFLKKILTVKDNERQEVKWAAKLFSNTVANEIRFVGEMSDDPYWKETADFVQLVNDWFDICNANSKYGPHEKAHAYGINLESQNEILDRMHATMKQLKIIPKNSHHESVELSTFLPFQHGVILNCLSLKELLVYLEGKYSGLEYVLTRRLNKDISSDRAFSSLTVSNLEHQINSFILGKPTTSEETSDLQPEDHNLTYDYVLCANKEDLS